MFLLRRSLPCHLSLPQLSSPASAISQSPTTALRRSTHFPRTLTSPSSSSSASSFSSSPSSCCDALLSWCRQPAAAGADAASALRLRDGSACGTSSLILPPCSSCMSLFDRLRALSYNAAAGRWSELQRLARVIAEEKAAVAAEEGESGPSAAAAALRCPSYRLTSLLPVSPLPFAFLGFTRSGAFLVSYSRGSCVQRGQGWPLELLLVDGSAWYLQLWRIEPPQRLRLSCEVRVWREQVDDGEVAAEEQPRVMVVESDDGRVLLVHAQPDAPGSPSFPTRSRSTFTAVAVPSSLPSLPSSSSLLIPPFSNPLSFSIDQAVVGMRLRCVALSPDGFCSSCTPASFYVLLLQTESAFLCFRLAFPGSDVLAAITSAASPLLPLPHPYPGADAPALLRPAGSLMALQRDAGVFGPCMWASWEEGEPEERVLSVHASLRLVDELRFDVEALISRLPRVGEGSFIDDYALCSLQKGELLLDSAPLSTSLSFPCPVLSVLCVAQRVAHERLAVHFVLIHFDLVRRTEQCTTHSHQLQRSPHCTDLPRLLLTCIAAALSVCRRVWLAAAGLVSGALPTGVRTHAPRPSEAQRLRHATSPRRRRAQAATAAPQRRGRRGASPRADAALVRVDFVHSTQQGAATRARCGCSVLAAVRRAARASGVDGQASC